MLNRIKSRRGFSLIELAVVLIVIGVIAAIAIPTFMTVIEKSEQKAVNSSADAFARNLDALVAFDGALSEGAVKAALDEAIVDDFVITAGEGTDTSPNGYTYTLADVDTDGAVSVGDTVTVAKNGKSATVKLGNLRAEVIHG